jgi:predicted TPR repeat methyltransferase
LRTLQHSSGDLLADRRASYAAALADGGDYAAGADLMQQALHLAPSWSAGWSLLGEYAERAGNLELAIAAWRRLADLDGDGVFGAHLKLAAHAAGAAVVATDVAYVEALFDDYAARFDAALLQRLAYEVPTGLALRLEAALEEAEAGQIAHAIDLGCGTGLMGERIRRRVSYLEGVDLSSGMIAECRGKGLYDRLELGELTGFLARHPGNVDLVTAADVFNYCGVLAPVLAAVRQALRPGGLLAFSIEAHAGPEPMILRPSLRFAHEPVAARAGLLSAGFQILCFDQVVLRLERGAPVAGYLVVAARARPPVPAWEEGPGVGIEPAVPSRQSGGFDRGAADR